MLYNAGRSTNTPSYFKYEKSSNCYFHSERSSCAGLLTEARKHGIRVPEDLAILGFDNHEISKALEISTIEHPGLAMGSHAFLYSISRSKASKLSAVQKNFHSI